MISFQDIQMEEDKLRNETKLLNLENKRNELQYKRRLYPNADLSSDEMAVNNLEKYLVSPTDYYSCIQLGRPVIMVETLQTSHHNTCHF